MKFLIITVSSIINLFAFPLFSMQKEELTSLNTTINRSSKSAILSKYKKAFKEAAAQNDTQKIAELREMLLWDCRLTDEEKTALRNALSKGDNE